VLDSISQDLKGVGGLKKKGTNNRGKRFISIILVVIEEEGLEGFFASSIVAKVSRALIAKSL
jgi:hypothetical protein